MKQQEPDDKQEFLVISRGQWDPDATQEQVQQAIDDFYVWYEHNLAEGRMKRGSRLAPGGKLVSRRSVIDGPFAEAKEVVGGFWFIIASNLAEAARIASENPCLAFGLTLEVRPLEQARAVADSLTNETPVAWRSQ